MERLLTALLFPATEPSFPDTAGFLFFFDSLTYYLPIEADGPVGRDTNLPEKLYTGYVPAPLGGDLDRFKRLLREMETSRADDLVRLFSATMGPFTTGQIRDREEISSGTVLSALQKDGDAQSQTQLRERLWQARLILKLAEILYRRQHEVSQGLARVDALEQKVFAALEGHSEPGQDADVQLTDSGKSGQTRDYEQFREERSRGASTLLPSIKMKAWTELFLNDSSPHRPPILVAANQGDGAFLIDGFENNWHRAPLKLLSISIPSLPEPGIHEPPGDQYHAKRNKLRASAQKQLQNFAGLLAAATDPQQSPTELQAMCTQLAEYSAGWENHVRLHFPNKDSDFKKLVFYSFPGVTTTALLQRLFYLKPHTPPTGKENLSCLLAVMNS